MEVLESSILQIRKYKRKILICRIRSAENSVAEDKGDKRRSTTSANWMSCRQWKEFESGLCGCLDEFLGDKLAIQRNKNWFQLDSTVSVKVRRSELPVKMLLSCAIDNQSIKPNDVAIALECLVECQDDEKCRTPQAKVKEFDHTFGLKHEHHPEPVVDQPQDSCSSPSIIFTPTPTSKSNAKSNGISTPSSNVTVEKCSPESVSASSSSSPSKIYKPKSNWIESKYRSEELSQAESNLETKTSHKRSARKGAKYKIIGKTSAQRETPPKQIPLKNTLSCSDEERKANKVEEVNEEKLTRKSPRTKNKPKRLIETIEEIKRLPSQKRKVKRHIIESSDNEDDFVKTPPQGGGGGGGLSLASAKKLKRGEQNAFKDEKDSMCKWLKKKSPVKGLLGKNCSVASNEKQESDLNQEVACFDKKEIEEKIKTYKEKIEENRKFKRELEELTTPTKKVDILSLEDMTVSEIIDTFKRYKSFLDEIFHKLKRKTVVSGYEGINFYSIVDLINPKYQCCMMEKLGEIYEDKDSSAFTKLFANAMLPEWILRIFMDKFNFQRKDAIQHLIAQNKYKMSQSDEYTS